MRLNTPITQNEYLLSDTHTIVSTTDLQGNITYANAYFVEVSGFTRQELIGAPQNILRHPDMPVEAFADFWATIKNGQSWTGMVKNRCKNGDYYWVLANVTPVIENGSPVGYMSVRTKPSREQVDAASKLYREIKEGNPNKIAIRQGVGVRTGLLARLASLKDISLEQRVGWNLSFLIAALLLLTLENIQPDSLSQIFGQSALSILSGVAVISALYFWYTLYTKLITPLKGAISASQTMAGGDLTQDIVVGSNDDMGKLFASLRQLRVNLHSVIGDIRSNFSQIQIATGEIATGNMDLSGRTESQASALEETASSMEELASTVQQNTHNAAEANKMAGGASVVAGKGGEIVASVVTTMSEISVYSKKIVEIISLIDGIAFQTNILALNAAVEAARAGEQGRGFAVVASEVRSLAQRSAAAANDIKKLISASVEKVGEGMTLAENAGVTMQEIIQSVQGVSSIMNDIAAASQEQSMGISQVNDAVTQMDDVTQQNAALVEQAAAAAGTLLEKTEEVVDALTVFKLAHQQAKTAPLSPGKTKSSPRSGTPSELRTLHVKEHAMVEY
ncbi:methyl-accepting chemotaxis protein [Herbaspirillum sp. RTI4]|uniref:methyl-accepting chemotaxis protein n=1 Tax=Herbaspirillum sp. RTI4 TaxID=3048640 RepID=UPI002AB5A11A|nr:methyl-accepting chemotaxis protein [Herbaspirillum sp. RTI4]MDY7579460.1 methyl-accepting chemotaxis protein [Herbaspirillum sp. RTI4]MEA9980374.1 methyl-accepting chemotaxis protein [Herbaspirillum sp. RTI4]